MCNEIKLFDTFSYLTVFRRAWNRRSGIFLPLFIHINIKIYLAEDLLSQNINLYIQKSELSERPVGCGNISLQGKDILIIKREPFEKYRVFIKYCVFSKIFKYSGLCFPSVSVCTHTSQVEHQCCSRTGRVQKIHKILRKKHNF